MNQILSRTTCIEQFYFFVCIFSITYAHKHITHYQQTCLTIDDGQQMFQFRFKYRQKSIQFL